MDLHLIAEDTTCSDCTEYQRRVSALLSDLTYANTAMVRRSELNRQQEAQVRRLMGHLEHAVDERDALRVQVEQLTRDVIALGTCRHDGPMGAIGEALAVAEGSHDKSRQWVIDQMVRALTGVDYETWRAAYEADGDEWDTGVPPMPRLDGVATCSKCGGSRKQDAGEDELGEVLIPCSACCCLCGEFTGDGSLCAVCQSEREEAHRD